MYIILYLKPQLENFNKSQKIYWKLLQLQKRCCCLHIDSQALVDFDFTVHYKQVFLFLFFCVRTAQAILKIILPSEVPLIL